MLVSHTRFPIAFAVFSSVSVFMEKTKQYALLQKVCVVFACGAMLFMLGSLAPDHDAQVAASFGLLGFFLIPLLPVNLESAAEVTYPVPEDNSAAVVLSAGQLLGIVGLTVKPRFAVALIMHIRSAGVHICIASTVERWEKQRL